MVDQTLQRPKRPTSGPIRLERGSVSSAAGNDGQRARILRKQVSRVKARFSGDFCSGCGAPTDAAEVYIDVRMDHNSGKKRSSNAFDK